MTQGIFEQAEQWESRSVSGFEGVTRLAETEFSGAVRADDTWLSLVNGQGIGVFGGSLDAFEGSTGTAYRAPQPALALHMAMRASDGQVEGSYYTNEVPISEVHDTLLSGNFTGYLELSENVLSGDYYVLYHGGESMSLAYVGASEDLVVGEDAFELATDEVGIYEVVSVELSVTELPDHTPETGTEPDSEQAASAASGQSGTHSDTLDTVSQTADSTEAPHADTLPNGAEPIEAAQQSAEATDPAQSGAHEEADSSSESKPEDTASPQVPPATATSDPPTTDSAGPPSDPTRTTSTPSDATSPQAKPEPADGAVQDGGLAEPVQEELRAQHAIPTLAPEESETPDSSESGVGAVGATAPNQAADDSVSDRTEASVETPSSAGPAGRSNATPAQPEHPSDDAETTDGDSEALRERVETLEAERDELAAQTRSLRTELADVQSELEAARAEPAPDWEDADDTKTPRDPATVRAGTNLFVRYESKGDPTLADAADGAPQRDVDENLRIDSHTQFDAAETTVEGESFASFLESSAEYQFLSWVVGELIYEIRETNQQAGLNDLYEAIPAIDRGELAAAVEYTTEDGDVETEPFDVVLRDQMGNPLVVANLNTDRSPVSGIEMESLVSAANAVATGRSLSAAIYVTESFFEPEALETAKATTGGGLLSRDSRDSFVRTGRNAGFHLCLVESREESFYMNLPEL